MEEATAGMARKWERHMSVKYKLMSYWVLLVGVMAAFMTIYVWPQHFVKLTFNSRLAWELILDQQDQDINHWSYQYWLERDPSSDTDFVRYYLFHVTNTQDVLENGHKPSLAEKGPYGFVPVSTKYDVSFSPDDSQKVTYKMYSYLKAPNDTFACEYTHFALELVRFVESDRDCSAQKCYCQSLEDTWTMINPGFVKLINREGPHNLMSMMSQQVFAQIKQDLTVEFVQSIFEYYVHLVLQDVYVYRRKSYIPDLIETARDFLLHNTTTYDPFIERMRGIRSAVAYEPCGLDNLGISSCSFNLFLSYPDVEDFYPDDDFYLQNNQSATTADFDELLTSEAEALLNASYLYSPLNRTYGFHRWMLVASYMGIYDEKRPMAEYLDQDAAAAYDELCNVYMIDECANASTNGTANSATQNESATSTGSDVNGTCVTRHLWEAQIVVEGIADWLMSWDFSEALTPQLYTEWANTTEPVYCSAQRVKCQWQFPVGNNLTDTIFQRRRALFLDLMAPEESNNKNPVHFLYRGNVPLWFDAYSVCRGLEADTNMSCPGWSEQRERYASTVPGYLWANVEGLDDDTADFDALNASEKHFYRQAVCNMTHRYYSTWMNDSFHNDYVIKQLNTLLPQQLNLTENNLEDIGYAQFGGSYVSRALFEVPSMLSVIREGMFRFVDPELFDSMLEYYGWAVINGYPHHNMSTADARVALDALANDSDSALDLRAFIAYQSTTFYGNGVDFFDGLGAVEDRAFTTYDATNSFLCNQTFPQYARFCEIMDGVIDSTATQCQEIELVYLRCVLLRDGANIQWLQNCEAWQTQISDSKDGLRCTLAEVKGEPHPRPFRRGNIALNMMFLLSHRHVLLHELLYCGDRDDCAFDTGGLFVTTSVRNMLFDGYVDPLILKVYNYRLRHENISLSCPTSRVIYTDHTCVPEVDTIATCDSSIVVRWTDPLGIAKEREMNASSAHPLEFYAKEWTFDQYTILNPFFSVFDGEDRDNTSYQRVKDCENTWMKGEQNLWDTCNVTLLTGRHDISDLQRYDSYYGNSTLRHTGRTVEVNKFGVSQFSPQLFEGMLRLRYNFQNRFVGTKWNKPDVLKVMLPEFMFDYEMEQFLSDFQEYFYMDYPVQLSRFANLSRTGEQRYTRYVETRADWDRAAEGVQVYDLLGMPYEVPPGFASVEWTTGFPVLLSTPHLFGNRLWGGGEFELLNGIDGDEFFHKSYIDMDPITGKLVRRAIRMQLNFRVERNVFQQTLLRIMNCDTPTNDFLASGYGCFLYIPLMWWEESRLMELSQSRRIKVRYKAKQDRMYRTWVIGTAIASVSVMGFFWLQHKQRLYDRQFERRVWVD